MLARSRLIEGWWGKAYGCNLWRMMYGLGNEPLRGWTIGWQFLAREYSSSISLYLRAAHVFQSGLIKNIQVVKPMTRAVIPDVATNLMSGSFLFPVGNAARKTPHSLRQHIHSHRFPRDLVVYFVIQQRK
ncbi:hypothetical protein K461DRAFT_57650 [Myriangium duriaei CBS 260.36]|uniref:Uncharacterized protein n=1 Tax=Myriangium duriaei CBS 260.36 TaxID=1168546 RepID=A0A9P4IYF0_9PEZI|nr:hypothetical protein K461DRAFT_57650 [Myriangium duriaei CBS 260.36]